MISFSIETHNSASLQNNASINTIKGSSKGMGFLLNLSYLYIKVSAFVFALTKTNTLALMEMKSLEEINLIFPGAAERPTEAPDGTIGKMVYDQELVMDSRK